MNELDLMAITPSDFTCTVLNLPVVRSDMEHAKAQQKALEDYASHWGQVIMAGRALLGAMP